MIGWLAALASGLLLTAAFPPLHWWPLAWLALVPLWAESLAATPRRSADLGAAAGMVFYGISLCWLLKIFGWAGAAFWCAFAIWIGLHAALIRALWDKLELLEGWKRDLAWTAAVAVSWVGIEYFRAEVWLLACAWLSLGFSQSRVLPVMQIAGLAGVYGVSAFIAASNAALVLGARGRRAPLWAVASLLGVALLGGIRLRDARLTDGEPIRVAAVQDEAFSVDKLSELTKRAPDAKLVVWPEEGFIVQPGFEDRQRLLVARKLAGTAAVVVTGGAVYADKPLRFENFVWALAPDGSLLGRYDKMHPIPFMERGLKAQPHPKPIAAPFGALGIQICYDLDFERGARLMVGRGARILAVPTLDPMEWGTWQHAQHSAMAAFRAVETGLWIVRAASSGASEIVAPSGEVRAALPFGVSDVLTGEARLRDGGTFYSRVGWLFPKLCLAATVLLILLVLPLPQRKSSGR